MEWEVAVKFLVELGIVIIHIDGQKRIRTGFDMVYYLLFYSIIFLAFLLQDKFLKKGWSSIKISFFSFVSCVIILLFWCFFLVLFPGEEDFGISIVLRLMFIIIELFVYSSVFCSALYFYRRLAK